MNTRNTRKHVAAQPRARTALRSPVFTPDPNELIRALRIAFGAVPAAPVPPTPTPTPLRRRLPESEAA